MIGAAFTALMVGGALELGALTGVATSRTAEDIEATAKLHSLAKAFLFMGIVLIVLAVIEGEA